MFELLDSIEKLAKTVYSPSKINLTDITLGLIIKTKLDSRTFKKNQSSTGVLTKGVYISTMY